jgi:uncharacterized protein (TIGR03083 family)
VDFASTQRDVERVCEATADLLRTAPDPTRQVSGLDWTVAELGAHLVTVARRHVAVADGAGFVWDPHGSMHDAMAAFNAREMAELAERDPVRLGSRLIEENTRFLRALGSEPDRPLRWPQYETRALETAQSWLGELLIHGLDLARTLGRRWPISREQAIGVFNGLLPALPAFASPAAARAAVGAYDIHLRGDGDYTLDIRSDGSVSATKGKTRTADLHVSADPVGYLLVGYGRANRWAALARGAVIAWGRKPWLAPRLANLFERP